jgi:nickel-dependent lactate racemase
VIDEACPTSEYRGKKVILIVPDATRTCPLGMLFKGIFDQIGADAAALDVMIALGTHQPMSEEAICHRLEISLEERWAKYGAVRLFNHEFPGRFARKSTLAIAIPRRLNPAALRTAKTKGCCWCQKRGKCCTTCANGLIGRARCEDRF